MDAVSCQPKRLRKFQTLGTPTCSLGKKGESGNQRAVFFTNDTLKQRVIFFFFFLAGPQCALLCILCSSTVVILLPPLLLARCRLFLPAEPANLSMVSSFQQKHPWMLLIPAGHAASSPPHILTPVHFIGVAGGEPVP